MPHANMTACTVSISLRSMRKLLPKLPGGNYREEDSRPEQSRDKIMVITAILHLANCYVTRSISFLSTAELYPNGTVSTSSCLSGRTLMFCYNTEQQLCAARCHEEPYGPQSMAGFSPPSHTSREGVCAVCGQGRPASVTKPSYAPSEALDALRSGKGHHTESGLPLASFSSK